MKITQTSIFKNIFAGCVLSLSFFLLVQCKKEAKAPIDLKKGYFPLKLNSVIIYDVDSTVYDDFTHLKTKFSFELKDSAVSEIQEIAGRRTLKFERYKSDKKVNNGEWIFQKVFTRTLIDLRGEEFQDNQRFVRIVFPPEKGKTWNGNTYNNITSTYNNTVGNQEYSFTDVHIPQTINSIVFDSTATINQINEFNLIREDYISEIYANHVGLIRREIKGIDKAFPNSQNGVTHIDTLKGLIYLMQVKSYK